MIIASFSQFDVIAVLVIMKLASNVRTKVVPRALAVFRVGMRR